MDVCKRINENELWARSIIKIYPTMRRVRVSSMQLGNQVLEKTDG